MSATSDPALTEDDPRLLRAAQEYLAALEAGQQPDRQAFVAQYPEVGAALGPYLEALDAVHAASPRLGRSSGGRSLPAADLPTEPLGDFKIVREIGRGGMGVVYEAVQLSLGRRVALKVLPFAAALDPRHLQRFKTEAQAAAQLHHPNIVPVYYVGTERGVHFYAMQLIEGRSLAAVIDELRGSPGAAASTAAMRAEPTDKPDRRETLRSTRGRSSYRTAATLAASVADALEYAHDAGIVHRDVKPANLLIDGRGAVWVTDFGLAHVTTATGPTQTGDILGTLRYMSPEQAGGQRVLIDPRADVYSLGATLYEFLTLRPIFDGTTHARLLDQILHEEPVAPRQVDRSIPVELETIVLKAVAKNPSERYATAGEMAADLRRFLDDQPIRARRPSLLDNATKWARRHRSMVVSAVVALLVSVAALSVSTCLAAWAYDREAKKAREAIQQRARAQEGMRQAQRTLELVAQVVEEEMAGNPGSETLRRRLLEVALDYYQDFIDQYANEPGLHAELEASRARAESILAELTTLTYAGRYGLLHQESVRKELRLTPAQREALARMAEPFGKLFHDTTGISAAERERRFLALAHNQETEVARLLTGAQMQRFQQIAIQQRGPQAFSDPDVVAALRLTPEQRKRIKEIQEEEAPRGPPGRGNRPGPDPPSRTRDKILDLLTADQKRAWEDLIGAAFNFDKPGGPPPGPRPNGPQRPGGPKP
jgi:serine/threonine protein kinase